jgi:hypothetical protein
MKQNKWDKLNKELDDALEEAFGSEEPKQETLEEASHTAWLNYEHVEGNLYSTSFKNGFKFGAKWQAERMYSEEDLRKAFENGVGSGKYQQEYGIKGSMNFEDWFEQFKKK